MKEPIIEVKNLSKRYYLGLDRRYKRFTENFTNAFLHPIETIKRARMPKEEFWALKDVSFTINEGEVVGIIGRNGAGKSTLLKILSQITYPTKGEVILRGRVGSLLEVGTGFHPELTGRENIYMNGAILGMRKREIDAKFDEIVKFAEIEKFLDTPVKRYSSGMYVRLAFAVAAHLEPEILLVDEVLAVGDAQFQKKCLGKMKDVSEGGRTVLFVSHNMTAIRTLCTRAILLKQGTKIADDDANVVVSKYIGEIKESILVREWKDEKEAPQNSVAVLRKVSVCNDKGERIEEITTDTPFNIEIEYRVKYDGASIGLTVIFYDNENNCVLGSINNHEPNWYGKPMPAGIYKSICKIPPHFLNNGWFNVSLNLFGRSFSDAKMTHEILKLEILDGSFVRKDYFGGYDGVVRPLFEWKTEAITRIEHDKSQVV